jgi:3-dehydroquinate synthetase
MQDKKTPTIETWTVETQLPVSFKIKKSPGLLTTSNPDLLEHGNKGTNSRRMLIIDQNLCHLYLDEVIHYFKAHAVEIHVVAIQSEEEDKNLDTLMVVLREMERFGLLRRSEPVIAIGGGVLLDIVGMAAGLYRRGIPYIRVPTTLVGLVDASVGAKTGINYQTRRNRLGSFFPPLASYLDKSFLKTLAPIEISSGLGEILKMAVIKDRALFELLEFNGANLVASKFQNCEYADEVINRAVQGMKEELENNLWEINLERIVDFGHSFSPIIEMRSIEENSHTPLTHGQAVTLDVIFSSVISYQRGLLHERELLRIARTAKNMHLTTDHELFHDPLMILEALTDTMKHRNGAQNLPMPNSIGASIFVNDLSFEEIKMGALGLIKLNEQLNLEPAT